MKIRDCDLQTPSSPVNIPPLHLYAPHIWLAREIQGSSCSPVSPPSLWGHRCSVPKSCLTLCDPKDCSTPGFPVHHYLPELAQTHVHQVSDAIQPSHPLLSPSPPAFYLSWVLCFHFHSCNPHCTLMRYMLFLASIHRQGN